MRPICTLFTLEIILIYDYPRHSIGDKNVFLVNTTGWVTYDDVFPDNQHPDVAGHAKIAKEFRAWLENWGLKPASRWLTV